jgi:hypothetical protein
MTPSDSIAVFAALISIISLAGTVYAVFFDMAHKRSERYAEIERDLPEVAFPLYGLDPKQAKREDVTRDEIIYLSSICSVLVAEAETRFWVFPREERINYYIDEEGRTYWKDIFRQPYAAKVWRYSRHLHSKRWRKDIDACFRAYLPSGTTLEYAEDLPVRLSSRRDKEVPSRRKAAARPN